MQKQGYYNNKNSLYGINLLIEYKFLKDYSFTHFILLYKDVRSTMLSYIYIGIFFACA